MTLEEHIKRYDDRARSIRNAIVEKKESQEVVELLRELEELRAGQKEGHADGYDEGYNCGYADAMNDIAESEG